MELANWLKSHFPKHGLFFVNHLLQLTVHVVSNMLCAQMCGQNLSGNIRLVFRLLPLVRCGCPVSFCQVFSYKCTPFDLSSIHALSDSYAVLARHLQSIVQGRYTRGTVPRHWAPSTEKAKNLPQYYQLTNLLLHCTFVLPRQLSG